MTYDNAFFARGLAAIADYEQSLTRQERAAINASNDAYAAEQRDAVMPALYSRDTAFSPALLKSALFSCAERGARAVFTPAAPAVFQSADGDKITYVGEQLRQDDESVLLAFIKMAAGQQVTDVLTLTPRAFVREVLGWSSSGQSVAKLEECIKRLKRAEVSVRYARGGTGTLSFVSDYDMPAGEAWRVWLAPRIRGLFDQRTTYLNADARRGLAGLHAWAFGFVNADACKEPFELEALREWSGSGADQKEFNRALKVVLGALQEGGLIAGFDMQRKTVAIRRATRH